MERVASSEDRARLLEELSDERFARMLRQGKAAETQTEMRRLLDEAAGEPGRE